MTSSSIEVPTTTDPASLATDLVGGKHYQSTKVFGGGEGVVNELVVEATGRLAEGAILVGVFAASSGVGGGTSYTAGDVIGDPVYLGRFPSGLYVLPVGLSLVEQTFVAPLFDVMLLGAPASPDGDPPATIAGMPADGSPAAGLGPALAPALAGGTFFDGEEATVAKLAPFAAVTAPGQELVIFDGASTPGEDELVDLYVIFVANAVIAAGDTNPSVSGLIRQVPSSVRSVSYTP